MHQPARGDGTGGRGEGGRRAAKARKREKKIVRACVIQRGEKSERSRTRTRRGSGRVKESCKEKEYIAVIIAIDFYRQTITPGSPDGYPRRSGDAFFSFFFPSASLPFPLFHALGRPRFDACFRCISHRDGSFVTELRLSLCLPSFYFLLYNVDRYLFRFKCKRSKKI